jgi:hypothetical protein
MLFLALATCPRRFVEAIVCIMQMRRSTRLGDSAADQHAIGVKHSLPMRGGGWSYRDNFHAVQWDNVTDARNNPAV